MPCVKPRGGCRRHAGPARLAGVVLGSVVALGGTQALAADAVPQWEGAIGPVLRYAPAYPGAATSHTGMTPGFFVRYGRWTVTNAGGFVTRRNDEVVRGLATDLIQAEGLRVNFALRGDSGRDAGDDPGLRGLDDVRPTVRGRLSATRKLYDSGWQLTLGLSADLFNRGGGAVADASIGREYRLSPRLVASWGFGLTLADRRNLRSYYGVDAAASVRSGYPEYHPGAGLRDISLGLGLRADISQRWVGFASLGASQLQGPARRSPLTHRAANWGLNGGLAWRF